MNYKYIEELVKYSKDGHEESKEKLIEEFTPFIINLCKKTFIHGYDFSDLQNECYKSLFNCVSLYNIENHRFVAYAINGIRNNLYDLIRKSQNRKIFDGSEALIMTEGFHEKIVSDSADTEDIICIESDHKEITNAISNLSKDDQEMINFLFFTPDAHKRTIKEYSDFKNISYSCAVKRRKTALKKLAVLLSDYKYNQ